MVVEVPHVAGLLEARGARVTPDHEYRLATRVLESVVVVCGDEHDFAGTELDVGVSDPRDAVTRDEVFELLRVRVPVDVVLRAGRKDCDAEDGVLRPYRLAREEPADVHVDPAVLRPQRLIARGRLEAPFHRVVADATDRLGHAPPPVG